MPDSVTGSAASSPVTEPCPHCGCPVADGEWFEDDEGTASCTCCALRDECDPNDPDCTCRREDVIVQEHADAGTESAAATVDGEKLVRYLEAWAAKMTTQKARWAADWAAETVRKAMRDPSMLERLPDA